MVRTTRNLRPKFHEDHRFAYVTMRPLIDESEWAVIEAHAQSHRESGTSAWTTEDSLYALLRRGILDEERQQAQKAAEATACEGERSSRPCRDCNGRGYIGGDGFSEDTVDCGSCGGCGSVPGEPEFALCK